MMFQIIKKRNSILKKSTDCRNRASIEMTRKGICNRHEAVRAPDGRYLRDRNVAEFVISLSSGMGQNVHAVVWL